MTVEVHHDVKISAVIFRSDDRWIAQGLEHDICTQADTIERLHISFARTVAANCAVSLGLGREPLSDIEPAPAKFWEMFKRAKVRVEPEPEVQTSTSLPKLSSVSPNYRLIEDIAA